MPCPTYADIQIDPTVIPQDRLAAIRAVSYSVTTKIQAPIEPVTYWGVYTNGDVMATLGLSDHILNFYHIGQCADFTKETLQETFQMDFRLQAFSVGRLRNQ